MRGTAAGLGLALAVLLAGPITRASEAGRIDLTTIPFLDQPYPDGPSGRLFAAAMFTAPDGTRLPYRMLSPPPGAEGTLRPLVLVVHGSGEMGADNQGQMDVLVRSWAAPAIARAFPAFVVAPQVAVRSVDYAIDADGMIAAHPGASFAALMALVETLSKSLPVDRSRVYVMGFSMGGSTSLLALAEHPERFAAAVAFSPVPPPRGRAASVAGAPVMLIHGTADPQNPIGPDRAWQKALAAAGGSPKVVEVAGMGHAVPVQMIGASGWRGWLFAQRRP